MKVTLVEGTINFSLIVVDENKLNATEETLASISPEEFFDVLPAGIIFKNFELNHESREVSINVVEATG